MKLMEGKHMKKIITAALTASLLLTAVSANAAEAVIEDPAKGVIKISGKAAAGDEIKILITNPGYTIDTAESAGAVQYADTITAQDTGEWEQRVIVNMDNGVSSGDFSVYVKEGNGAVLPLEAIYYVSAGEKYDKTKEVVSDVDKLTTDDEVKKVLGLTNSLYTSIDMSVVAEKLKTSLTENPIAVGDGATDEEKLERFSDLSGRIKELAVIQAYKEGKSAVVLGKDNSFNYEDVLKLQTLDTDKGITAYALYSTALTQAGKAAVQNGMLKSGADSVEALQRLFTKLVMFYGIGNNSATGYGHISNYITEANVCFALNVLRGNTPVETYLSLTDKAEANYAVMNGAESLTLDNFLSKIESAATTLGSETPGSQYGSKGGGGSSSGGGSFSIVGMPAVTEKKDEDETGAGENTGEVIASVFSDVPQTHWANKAVEYLAEREIINGVGTGMFAPSDYLTREQAVKIICTAFDIRDIKTIDANGGQAVDITDYNMFDDVENGKWYSESVFAAYRNSIINGVAHRRFGIGMYITREDAASVLFRAMKAETQTEATGFADDAAISDYAKKAVGYMKEAGIINGYSDNTFRPKNNITRAEMAQIMYNILMEG